MEFYLYLSTVYLYITIITRKMRLCVNNENLKRSLNVPEKNERSAMPDSNRKPLNKWNSSYEIM